MINRIVIFVLLMILSNNVYAVKKERGAYATNNFKGQKYYLEACSSCHGAGSRGGNMESIREWKTLFSGEGSELYDLHLDENKTENILIYLKSDTFKKEKIRMLPFLQEFAYDSENIPTCY